MTKTDISKINVTKRDGRLEPIDLNKIHRVLEWATEDLNNVSVSMVELRSHIQFFNGIKTEDIHEMIIKTAADLIDIDTPDYQYMAARLAVFHLRKLAYGKFTPPTLFDHTKNVAKKGYYDDEIFKLYTKKEFNELDKYIDHDRDLNFAYAGIMQLEGKYLVQNRVTGEIFESPQMLYMLVAMTLFSNYKNKEERMDYVKRFYDAISLFKISLPTPIMAGVRTKTRQFSSCVLVDCDDSLDSINATTSAIVKYISQRAGIGVNGGKIRALGSEIRGGEASHTGVIPFYKMFQAGVKSCSQGGVRGGAATLFYPIWHLEVENLLVLKNNKGVEENRIRHMDYGVQISKLFYTRLIKNELITLFSPNEVPGLYDSFFEDEDKFEELYKKYEADKSIRKKQISAIELFQLIMRERANTGRIYIQNVDHCNTHSGFRSNVAPIRQSNLCMEITLPTQPLNDIKDENGEIALCTLSAINLGAIESIDELEEISILVVRALDELLDYQNYPVKAAEISNKSRRSLGVGIINFAYYLAKNNVKYSDGSAKELTHETFEAFQYYLLKASNQLAKEKGSCKYFNQTNYSIDKLPIDNYKKDVDKLISTELKLDWDQLRKDIKKYGLRNSVVSAIAPTETSSQVSNATNGIEPPRGYITVKQSKNGVLKQVVPEFKELESNYELLWDLPNNNGYLELVAIIQKFIDQSISTNTSYDPSKFPGNKVPMQQMIKDLLLCYKLGLKTLYYHNTRDGATDEQNKIHFEEEDDGCAGGACKI